jgi:hypothetical protein
VALAGVTGRVQSRLGFPQVGKRQQRMRRIAVLALAASLSAWCEQKPASGSPQQLVRQAIENEVRGSAPGMKLMFTDRKETAHGSQVELIVETSEGPAGLVIESDGKALSAEQRDAEDARLDTLLHNPAELKRKQKAEREDSERTARILRALPDAFLFQFDGTENGSEGTGSPGDELVRLRFRSNPNYIPPSRTEQVLTGMQGYILVDTGKKRIARIDGTLFKDVTFGWGIFGRLEKGGRFVVQQGVVTDGAWDVTHMQMSFSGKELLFKRILIKSNEIFTDFQPAPPNLTFAQGVELLKKQQAALAEQQQNSSSHQVK